MSLYKLKNTIFYSYTNPVNGINRTTTVEDTPFYNRYVRYLEELHTINDFNFFQSIPRNLLVQNFYLCTITFGFSYKQSYKGRNRIFQDNKSFLQDKADRKLTYDSKEVISRIALEVTDMDEKKYKTELIRIAKEVA